MMIVLENAKATDKYPLTTGPRPSNIPIKNPAPEVNSTCPTPVARDIPPTSLTLFQFSPSPTVNNKKATPICDITSNTSGFSARRSTPGPAIIPVRM